MNAIFNTVPWILGKKKEKKSKHSALKLPIITHSLALKTSYYEEQAVTFQALVQCAVQRIFIFEEMNV
jgi:hypothetical protein